MRPFLVLGQRCGDDDRDPVVGRGFVREVDAQILIRELGLGKWMAALGVAQRGRRMRPERFAVGQQEVESAVRCDPGREIAQGMGQLLDAGQARMRFPQLLHDPAERALAVGVADGAEMGVQFGSVFLEVAVVGKHPVAAPQLAHERVAVLQAGHALGGLADMGNDIAALDRVFAYQLGHRRRDGALMVDEVAQSLFLEERDAPAVGVITGIARALRKAAEAKAYVGRGVAIHSKKLAHGEVGENKEKSAA